MPNAYGHEYMDPWEQRDMLAREALFDAFGRARTPASVEEQRQRWQREYGELSGDYREEDEEYEAYMTQAAKSGYELGAALAALFGSPKSLDFQAIWTVGSFYAKMSGYNTLDAGREFMTGFGQGLSGSSPKALTAGGSDGE